MKEKNMNHAASKEYVWQIRVRSVAHLDDWIKDYFGGVSISNEKDGCSLITGELPDMPAVYGLILQLRDAGISLISLQVERQNKG